ncbi:MAG: FtsW/RodA/SpoVE family cell cycle protein [Ruminococcus sp.]|uniref:FtsW/RodA/SpoVE family cell cycle protein n=1 Tax=unclassified Ruminococcus TaxID=2608920 RepID=UPI002931CF56|nr:FtsW/RodA/SpoVE family cell cycle protein [uncultured Ruminococcus sp.]MBQ1354151.1 FtsW/RodA/SpoVE family cell cycle protein [Ruminococcus sp.]MBQ1586048.1 FtsW/RodA/SpoVE family cell cycle protein [Ruminococcus sp.]MBQ1595382.1 FtsW/RodA/SpoVE family cell cycle protein [Ruminococcus sp.]MBQ1921069.1 FtsW/RodA/SpoVE family cell cycle protein [Ruminococcus sp.]MBQ2211454.1 FtsW/RodA/SpoVE family cell cycle protein [Ruminococcus sp.]
MFDFSVIIDIGVVALRILLPLYAIFIVYQCYAAMRRRRRPEKPLVTLMNTRTFEKIPVLFWENSIGRKKSNDVVVEDAAVSKVHAVLLRRDEGWFINDTESLHGTFVNGRRTEGRTQVYIDDIIRVGNTDFQFLRGEEYNEELRSSWFFKNPSQKPAVKSWKLMLMITLFHFFMTVEAVYWNDGKNLLSPLIIFGIVAAVNWGMFIVSYFGLRRTTFELEALALFLSGIGTILLARQYERSAYMQVISTVVGFVIFCAIIKLIEDPDKLYRFRIPLMIAAVGLLGVSIVFGKVTNGAANWIYIGPLSFQPSELVKVIYILIGAGALDKLNTKKDLFIFIGFSVVCVGLLAVMRDLGTALIFFVTFLLIAFMRSGDFKTIILAVSAAVFGAIFAIRFMPYVADRFKAYRHVWEYAQAEGYQQTHVLTFIASGGLFGVGIGNGFLKQVAASESDLVFGLVAEEMGIIVAITLALAVALLVVYARAITTRSRSTFYSISACCAAGLLVVQLTLNIFGATDLLPLTGVTFPFISAGGSSVIGCWGLIAFIKAADERTYSMKR